MDHGHPDDEHVHDASCEVAHGTVQAPAENKVLAAVFATPVSSYLLRYASDAVQDFTQSSVAEQIRRRAAATVVDPRVAALTPAQRRVFALLCEGLSDKEIAKSLSISPETAKNHAARVRVAFGVHSRAALIASARGLAEVV